MKFLILHSFLSLFFWTKASADTTVEALSLKKSLNSLIYVVTNSNQGQFRAPGLITKDPDGHLQVLTSFRIFSQISEFNTPLFVLNKAGSVFPLKGIRRVAPLRELIALSVKGDLTEQGKFPPVELAPSLNEEEPLFYTFFGDPWFKAKPVEEVLSFPGRLDFIVDISISTSGELAPFVINQKGELVSFVTNGTHEIVFGLPLNVLRDFLSYRDFGSLLHFQDGNHLKPFLLDLQESCSPSFLRGCLVKAMQVLYRQAQGGDHHDSYQLVMFLGGQFARFEMFLQAMGVDDPNRARKEWEVFLKSSALWEPSYYYMTMDIKAALEGPNLLRLPMSTLSFFPLENVPPEMTDSESEDFLESLTQENSIRDWALQGHPYFQYVMGVTYFKIGNPAFAIPWINLSSDKGYMPGQFAKAWVLIASGIQVLIGIAEGGNFAPAKKMLGLLNQNLSEAERFLKDYNKSRMAPRFTTVEYFRRFSRWLRRGFSLKSAPDIEAPRTPYENSLIFDEALLKLTTGLGLLKALGQQGYIPAKDSLNHFEKGLRIKARVPSFSLSEELDQECLNVFNTQFAPMKTNTQ